MNRIRFGLVAGVVFGAVDVLPMLGMAFPDPVRALSGAFASRFAIGFLIPQVRLPFPGWLSGGLVGLLISTPDMIVTGTVLPILTTGLVGGAIIGVLHERKEKRTSTQQATETTRSSVRKD